VRSLLKPSVIDGATHRKFFDQLSNCVSLVHILKEETAGRGTLQNIAVVPRMDEHSQMEHLDLFVQLLAMAEADQEDVYQQSSLQQSLSKCLLDSVEGGSTAEHSSPEKEQSRRLFYLDQQQKQTGDCPLPDEDNSLQQINQLLPSEREKLAKSVEAKTLRFNQQLDTCLDKVKI